MEALLGHRDDEVQFLVGEGFLDVAVGLGGDGAFDQGLFGQGSDQDRWTVKAFAQAGGGGDAVELASQTKVD